MGLRFKCPECGGNTLAYDIGIGELTRCKICGKEIEIPTDLDLLESVPEPKVGKPNSKGRLADQK